MYVLSLSILKFAHFWVTAGPCTDLITVVVLYYYRLVMSTQRQNRRSNMMYDLVLHADFDGGAP